jgi:hypothetical protein
MDTEKLINLKNKIENLDKTHHSKILNVLMQNEVKFSENRNGSFINMNNLNETTVHKIEEVLKYISIQEKHLQEVEKIKSELNHDYFSNKKLNDLSKGNKDNTNNYKYKQ